MVFLDGQRSLHSSVLQALSGWAPVQLIKELVSSGGEM